MSILNLTCDECHSRMFLKVDQRQNVIVACQRCRRLYYFLAKDMFKMLGIKFPWEIKEEKEWEEFVKMVKS